MNAGDGLLIWKELAAPAKPEKKGVSRSSLLGHVFQAVAQACKSGIWTLVEIMELRANGVIFTCKCQTGTPTGGDGQGVGRYLAVHGQCNSSKFERASGAQLAPRSELLVRAWPVFKAQFGFGLDIDAINLEYTLGEMAACKRDIWARLLVDGVPEANKNLLRPWHFKALPACTPTWKGVGLGDFKA